MFKKKTAFEYVFYRKILLKQVFLKKPYIGKKSILQKKKKKFGQMFLLKLKLKKLF